MTRHTPAILMSALLLAISSSAMAAGQSGNHGNSGGKSASHASASSDLNSNGPNALDRDKGKARAADRHAMHHGKHKRHHQPPAPHKPARLPDAG
ncbi:MULTISPECIES: hypothetical protein [Aquitalea]|uniref:hypothetical protein n=1 Tax=Aquitalea TaxID=407217 RepID=UPI0013569A1A|nr:MULTISPECIES: hypothetical protein [Aquitalea]